MLNTSNPYPNVGNDCSASNTGQADPEGMSTLEKKTETSQVGDAPYTAFKGTKRAQIAFLVSFAGFFSPLSANIYFPALPSLSNSLHVSIQLLNLTITAYLVVQGIAPSITGDLADMIGRRPVYCLVLSIYLGANIGLACQSSYVALLVLRILQSIGVSGTASLYTLATLPKDGLIKLQDVSLYLLV